MKPSELKLIPRPSLAQLKSTTVLPIVLGLGVASAGFGLAICFARPSKAAAISAKSLPEAVNPNAMPRGVQLAACNPCNPCSCGQPLQSVQPLCREEARSLQPVQSL